MKELMQLGLPKRSAFMLRNGVSTIGIGLDFLVLITTFTGLVAIAARLYPRMGE